MPLVKTAATTLMVSLFVVIGCGTAQPSPIHKATVTIEGQPNEEVYVSVDASVVTVESGSKSVQGFGNYGVKTLDESGILTISVNGMIEPKPLHGFTVTVVTLNDAPIKLTVSGDGLKERVAEVSGKLEYADMQFGYQTEHEPDSPMAHDPENSVYEAREFLKNQSARTADSKDQSK